MLWTWHDRLRDLTMQCMAVGIVLAAVDRIVGLPSLPPFALLSIGGLIGAGNVMLWRREGGR